RAAPQLSALVSRVAARPIFGSRTAERDDRSAVPAHGPELRRIRCPAFTRVFPKNRCERTASGISPGTKKFFCKNVFHRKATPFLGQTVFGQVFVRGGMNKISKWKVPPTRARGSSLLDGLTALKLASVHCCAPRGLIARSYAMRCTVPVPIPRDVATFKIPTPFASWFRTFRSVAHGRVSRPALSRA